MKTKIKIASIALALACRSYPPALSIPQDVGDLRRVPQES